MQSAIYAMARQALFALEPETAHEVSLRALESGIYPRQANRDDAILAQDVFGIAFPNPLGIAAGYDKDARVPDAVLGLGCGFAEVGTLTPKPQPGNPKPRVFRLVADKALINRLGFNNGGHASAIARLEARCANGGIVGVNIGANKESADFAGDYVKGIEVFYHAASYFTVNISSPNTPGLRNLQQPQQLRDLLERIMAARARQVANGASPRPVIVKIAPDIAEDDIPAMVAEFKAHAVDGIAVSNTTLSRPGLKGAHSGEAGGLSGRPLFYRSTAMLARFYQATDGKIPLIGIGGIDSAGTALTKIEAGATLLQLYTGLVYEGPALIGKIKTRLADEARRAGKGGLAGIRGRKAAEWAKKQLV